MRLIIGLTGLRGVGKSEVAAIMERRGFLKAHAFAGGKAATIGYFRHLGADEYAARQMADGSLKDEPSALLPGGVAPRMFMERLGKFMGVDLGTEWTLGAELDRLEREAPDQSIIIESVVYEALALRSRGGIIIRVERPGHVGPAGMETDKFQASIIADHTLVNDGDLGDLEGKIDGVLGSSCNLRKNAN